MIAHHAGESRDGRENFAAHWTIFLPSLVVAGLYGGSWLLLLAAGLADTALARLLLIVCVVVVPLLLVQASLRYQACRLVVGRRGLRCRSGWLRPRWRRIALTDIESVRGRQSVAGRLLGGGVLVVRLKDGRKLRLDDLDAPMAAARAIETRLESPGPA